MNIEEIIITPALAAKYLERNLENINVSEKHVLFLSGQMQTGKWKITGDAIKFGRSGKLIDGQHRLLAIIKSGKSFKYPVITGLPDDAFEVMDTGKNRNASDILSLKGVTNSSHVATMAKFVMNFENGKFFAPHRTNRDHKCTNSDVLHFASSHPEIAEIVTYCAAAYNKFRVISPGVLAGLYYLFCKKNQFKCDDFFDQYSTGLNLTNDNPIYLLREVLIKDSIQKRKLPMRDKIALFILAWNAFIKGKSLKRLVFNDNQDFPTPL